MYFIKKIENWKLSRWWDITEFISKRSDGIYSIEIKKFWDRSTQANRYYWGVVLKSISEQTGNSPDELHFFFKTKILGVWDNGFPSTKELNSDEFTQYINDIKNMVAELWYYVPEI